MAPHNSPTDSPDVYAIGPVPPEVGGYAMARASRSPDSLRDSLRWVHEKGKSNFWETYYFAYGHSSVADLASSLSGLMDISELAAIHVEDEPLWNGQAKSSRYQNFGAGGYVLPAAFRGHPSERLFIQAITGLSDAYRTLQGPVVAALMAATPQPEGMVATTYERTMQARAFDVIRYLLPLATRTNVCQLLTIRVLEKQITKLLSSPIEELQDLGRRLVTMCAEAPDNTWGELNGYPAPGPLAPTLARYGKRSEYLATVYARLRPHVQEILHTPHAQAILQASRTTRPVTLVAPQHPLDEVVTSLLYRVSTYPYDALAEVTASLSSTSKTRLFAQGLEGRTEHDEPIREYRSGHQLMFDIQMDLGAWRDLHRHRRCVQIWQEFTPDLGYETPALLEKIGLVEPYRQAMNGAHAAVRTLTTVAPYEAQYLLPFGTRVRCLFKCDLDQIRYIVKTRTTVKGHWAYRTIAWQMREAVLAQYPMFADFITGVSPDIEDTLTR